MTIKHKQFVVAITIILMGLTGYGLLAMIPVQYREGLRLPIWLVLMVSAGTLIMTLLMMTRIRKID